MSAHRRGVKVFVVADKKGNTSQYTAVTFLANQGVPVRVNGKYAIQHNKYIVVDGRHVKTGSFNFSAAAQERNAENVLVIWNLPSLAEQYTRDWQKLWDGGEDVAKRY